MGKRKVFIDKTKCVTFRLQTAENERPVITGDPELNNIVDVTEEELQEREKFGVYFNDNYNYLYHMKSKDDPIDLDVEETAQINLPVEAIRQPVVIKEVKGREVTINGQQLRPSSSGLQQHKPQMVDLDPDLDADLLAAMEAAEAGQLMEEGDEGDFDLDDNFLELAGGVDEPEARRVFEQFRKTNPIGSDGDSEDDEDQDDDMDPEDSDEDMDEEEGFKVPAPILKKADKEALDERFNHFYANMDNDADEEEFDEDEEFAGDDGLLDDFANDYQESKEKVYYEKPDEESKKLTLAAFEKQATSKEDTQRIEVPIRQKRAKWDCESIVSTYSNIYNHPTLIREAPKRKDTQLSRKALKHTDVEMKDETASVRSAFSAATFRPRGETADERRERKNAIKAERRDRRQEKKANKDVFKQEKKKMDAQRGAVQVSGRHVS